MPPSVAAEGPKLYNRAVVSSPDFIDGPIHSRGADLSGRDLSGLDLSGSDLRDCNLRGALFRRSRLRGAQLSGAELAQADLSGADLEGAVLDGAHLQAVRLDGARLVGVRARDSGWVGVDCTGGDWRGIDLDGATFRACNLKQVVLGNARLDHVRMVDCTWLGVDASAASCRAMAATDVTWEDVDLRGADLWRAALRFADLRRIDLRDSRAPESLWESVEWSAPQVEGSLCPGARVLRCRGLSRTEAAAFRTGGAAVPTRLTWLLFDVAGWGARVGHRGGGGVVRVASAGALQGRTALGRFAGLLLLGLTSVGRALRWTLRQRWVFVSGVAAVLGWFVFVRAPLDELRVPTLAAPEEVASQRGMDKAKREADEKRMQEILDALERGDPVAVEDRIELAEILERIGRYADAEDQLIDAVETHAAIQADLSLRAAASGGVAPEVPPDQDPDLVLWAYYLRRNRLHDAIALARERLADARNPWEEVHARVLVARTWLVGRDLDQWKEEEGRVIAMLPGLADGGGEFRLALAAAHEEADDLPGAMALLAQMPRAASVEDRAECALLMASLMATMGDLASALLAWEHIEEEFADAPLIVAKARDARGRHLEADATTSEASLQAMAGAADPAVATRGGLGLARLAARAGRGADAELRYEEIIRRHPGQGAVVAVLELSEARWARGAVADALEGLEVAEEGLEPTQQAPLRLRRAEWLVALGRPEDAEGLLSAVLVALPADGRLAQLAQLGIAGAKTARGDLAGATALYRRLAEGQADPETAAAAWAGLAEEAEKRGALDEALPLSDLAWRLAPPRHRVRGRLAAQRAELLVQLGRGDPASLDTLLSDARAGGLEEADPPAFGRLVVRLAQSLLVAGRPADALASFARVQDSPAARNDVALRELAMEGRVGCLIALGRKEEADRWVDSMPLSDLRPGDAQQVCGARASLARSRLAMHDIPGAVTAWRELFTECRAPRLLTAVLPEMADAMGEAGATREAELLLREVRDADLPDVGRQAACLELLRLGNLDEATCAEEGPDAALGALGRVEHAKILVDRGRLAEAEPLWTAVLSDAGAEPISRALALLGLARLAHVRGDGQLAHQQADEAGQESQDPWIQEQVRALQASLPPKGTPKR